jgi:predicted ATPase
MNPQNEFKADIPSTRRFVLAGGPGTGKSTLVSALAASGQVCYEECSRGLIKEQLAAGGRLVPWQDLLGFALECSRRMCAQISDSAMHTHCFFDRGLPDLIGYLRSAGYRSPDAWAREARAYASTVFFAPPWREIYRTDAERPQDFAEAEALGTHVRQAYLECGFTLVELVKGTVSDRVHQVLSLLNLATASAQSWETNT